MITNRNQFFFDGVIRDALAHAKEVFPEECCGAVIREEYVRFENKADKPDINPDSNTLNSFVINDPSFYAANAAGDVQAVIHSHDKDPHASIEDQQQQMALDLPFGLINLVNRAVTHCVFWGDSLPVEPLMGRHFVYGVWDCFSLVRDYFRVKLGLLMPNVPREYGFWLRGESMFEKWFDSFDAEPVDKAHIRPNDILLYNLHGTRFLNHCAVYQENGLVLHHFENHVSQALPLSFNQQFLRSARRMKGVS